MKIFRNIDIINKSPLSIALGFFDGVHIGHREIIKKTKKNIQNGYESAVFTFSYDKDICKGKFGSKKLISNEDKLNILKTCKLDKIFFPKFSEIVNMEARYFIEDFLVKKLNCKEIVCGKDFRFGKNALGDINLLKEICDKYNLELNLVEEISIDGERVSSTLIKQFLLNGDVKSANKFLGYKYNIDSTVIKGDQLARKLGYKTINQVVQDEVLVPKYGVYASNCFIDGVRYPSVSNIGVKPTFRVGNNKEIFETHIFGVNKNLYDKKIKVEFLDFIRAEKNFEKVDFLKSQIKDDANKALKIYNDSY